MTIEQSKTSDQPLGNKARQEPLTSVTYARNYTNFILTVSTKLEMKVAVLSLH